MLLHLSLEYVDVPPQRTPVRWEGALIPGCPHFRSVTGFPPGGGCMSSALRRCSPSALCLIVEKRVSLCCTLSRWPKQNRGWKVFLSISFVIPWDQLHPMQVFASYMSSFKLGTVSHYYCDETHDLRTCFRCVNFNCTLKYFCKSIWSCSIQGRTVSTMSETIILLNK